MWTVTAGNILIAHRHMCGNVEIGTEAKQFPEKEYIYGIFIAVLNALICTYYWSYLKLTAGLLKVEGTTGKKPVSGK